MLDFNAILVEGLFYDKDGALHIEKEGGDHVSLADVLAPVVGQRVQMALHHLPPSGIDPSLPGAGSCRFPGGRGCPAGHERAPDRLLSFHMDGVLRADPWRVERFDGTVHRIPVGGMPGHYGRVGAATVVDVEKMREALSGLNVEEILGQGLGAQDLEGVLERLKKAMEQ